MKRLLLIDATAYLFRAYHAMGDLRTKSGKPSGAVFGTLTMLGKLRQRHPGARIACVLDAPGTTFRHELYADYKATRPPTPEDIKAQSESLCDFINAWGLPLLRVTGVEADDVIATYARAGAAQGMEVTIASSDKDLMQLVQDGGEEGRIQLYDGMKDKTYDRKAVVAKYGVPPEKMGDYLALMGDASDNIPGVKKVGPKTAVKWLTQYGKLADVCEHAAEVPGVVGNNLRAAIDDGTLKLSRRLVELKEDVNDLPPLDDLLPRAPDKEQWRQLCSEFEFRRLQELVEELPVPTDTTGAAKDAEIPAASRTQIIHTEKQLADWVARIKKAGSMAVDVETRGAPVMQAELVGISLAVDGEAAAYIPLAHTQTDTPQLAWEVVRAHLAPLLQDENIGKILHNGKYDWHVFANAGVHLAGILDDTKIAAYCHDPSQDNTLGQLAQHHLAVETTEYKELVDGKTIKDFAAVPLATAADYAGEDAWVTHRLHAELQQRLTPAAKRIYEEIDRPLMPLLGRMERAGMKINTQELSAFAADLRVQMEELQDRAFQLAGTEFNLNSPRQLEKVLFDDMGAKPLRKTGGGARSTNERTLEHLASDYPLAACLLEYRTLAKLVGTYAEKLPQEVHAQSGRIHTSFNQTAVSTGRLSSSAPNLQNIPIKTEHGRRIRRAFVADTGKQLISADYSQIELRIMAHIAQDATLLAAFAAGADIHRQTASEVFGTPLPQVSDEQRRAAKAINFGLIYGMSSYGLARTLGVGQPQALDYIERYFNRYPQVAALMDKLRQSGIEQGYVETIVGRRILVQVGNGGKPAAERFAINAPIQGSAADVMKAAMLAVDAFLHREKLPATILLQVHDELVLEVEEGAAEEVRAQITRVMSEVANLSVSLEVEAGIGSNWGEAH